MDQPTPPPPAVLLGILFSKMTLFSLRAVVSAGVADVMSEKPIPAEGIARELDLHGPTLFRVLRALASAGIFEQTPNGFALTPVGALLRKDSPGSLRDMVLMFTDPWQITAFQNLDHSLRTGGDAVSHAFGKQLFELFREIPEQAEHFHDAMTDLSRSNIPAVLQVADFSRFHKMADVGGGHGMLLGKVLESFPNLQGVVFDLPEVVAGAASSGHFAGTSDRVSFDSGSFFERVPSGCDAYIMKHIIHDWDDARATRILAFMRAGLAKTAPEKGRVFLVELVVPDLPGPDPAKLLDIEMLVNTPGGKERTSAEFAALFASAGLQQVSITHSQTPFSLIEARLA